MPPSGPSAGESTSERLLRHAQRLFTLGSADDILAASCAEVLAQSGVERVFARCQLPRGGREHGLDLEVDRGGARPASPAARSALFALHRRAVTAGDRFEVARGEDTTAIFAGLRCADDVDAITVLPILHRTGRVWGEVALVGRAVTEGLHELVRFAAIALENAQRLLFVRRDQDRLLLLAEATDEAFYDWDLDTRDFWWGGGVLRLYGSDADPVDASVRWKHARIHPDDVARVVASFEAARVSSAPRWVCEYRFRRDDGSYRDVEDRAYLLRDVGGRAYRIIGSLRDVTPIKRALEREHEARTQAERASRAKDEFLAMLGHELRNPLAPILTGLELLRVRGTVDVERDLPVLQRQAQHLIRLVDDLLDISRIAHGKIELRRERLELAPVVQAAIELAGPLLEARRHHLHVQVPAHGLEVDADRARLAQALANVVTNAAKYTEPGGDITITAARDASGGRDANGGGDGEAIAIRVRDTGIGIAPEMLPHVFHMFVQEPQALDRAHGGLGLGLSIVRSLVELHGGAVEARSDGRGRGSEFILRLPAATPAAAVRPTTLPAASPAASGRRVMVVDDNEDAAELLSTLLEHLGNTTRVAHDAQGALALLDDFGPEVAVLDIGLPRVDGYELARLVRARVGHGVQLIALTGYGQASDAERAARAGFDAHLVKPVALEKLRALIAAAPA